MHSKEFAENQWKHQNFDPSNLPYKFGLIFMRMKQKKKKFFEEKNSKWRIFQNRRFSKSPILENFLWKFYRSVLGLVIRLSDIRAKTGKKCIFCVFRLFLPLGQTTSQPYKLSYSNGLRINQSYYPKDWSVKFLQKNLKNWRFWKTAILKNRPFWIFFLLHSHENQSKFVW